MDDYLASLTNAIGLLRSTTIHNDIQADIQGLVAEAEALVDDALRMATEHEPDA